MIVISDKLTQIRMHKFYLALGLSALLLAGSGCGQPNAGGAGPVKNSSAGGKGEAAGVRDVCKFFPKEIVESAIGRPIAKMEVPFMGKEYCVYYTEYRADYNHAPGGDTPGGPSIQLVYENKSAADWKAAKEKAGDKVVIDPSIGMENFTVLNRSGQVWQVVLVLAPDEYLRMHFINDAVSGAELVKIAAKMAEELKK